MECQKCGGYIRRRDTFCPHCGAKLTRPKYKPQQKSRNSEYKPLQGRYKRGEYQDREEDFYDQYIEDQHMEDQYQKRPAHQKPRKRSTEATISASTILMRKKQKVPAWE